MKTRYADKEDLPKVYTMYLRALEELGEEYDETKALEFVLSCWSKAPTILLEDKGIIGFAGLNTGTIAYNNKTFLKEYMFYISPEKRGLKSWRALTKAVQKVSDEHKIPFLGEHKIQGKIKHHARLIRMAGARPISIRSVYGETNGR